MGIIILLSFILLYYLRSKEAKWLWLFFILIILSNGMVRFENPTLTMARVFLLFASLVMAIVKTKKEGI